MMCEIPSNILLAKEFCDIFDGFSIGSNDLTQLTLGVDRDSERLSGFFDERNPSVTGLIQRFIEIAHSYQKPVGICGEAPSRHSDFTDFLVRTGIDSISVDPDAFQQTREWISNSELGSMR
jgi:pyruvate,water dikinase